MFLVSFYIIFLFCLCLPPPPQVLRPAAQWLSSDRLSGKQRRMMGKWVSDVPSSLLMLSLLLLFPFYKHLSILGVFAFERGPGGGGGEGGVGVVRWCVHDILSLSLEDWHVIVGSQTTVCVCVCVIVCYHRHNRAEQQTGGGICCRLPTSPHPAPRPRPS